MGMAVACLPWLVVRHRPVEPIKAEGTFMTLGSRWV